MPYVYVPLPDYKQFTPLDSTAFRRKANALLRLKAEIDSLKEKYDEQAADVMAELLDNLPSEIKSVNYNGQQLSVVTKQPGQSLNKRKLAVRLTMEGLDVDEILRDCSDPTSGAQYLMVRPVKEKTETDTAPAEVEA